MTWTSSNRTPPISGQQAAEYSLPANQESPSGSFLHHRCRKDSRRRSLPLFPLFPNENNPIECLNGPAQRTARRRCQRGNRQVDVRSKQRRRRKTYTTWMIPICTPRRPLTWLQNLPLSSSSFKEHPSQCQATRPLPPPPLSTTAPFPRPSPPKLTPIPCLFPTHLSSQVVFRIFPHCQVECHISPPIGHCQVACRSSPVGRCQVAAKSG
mmetsp:Transcript_4813/g.8301  ORF Transcript_4813/g.8301 Transcript_4813/m.8301 type:complete len:210 (+) Transcript_4813:202-831(+)